MTFFGHSKTDTFYCIENAALDKVLGILLDRRLNFRDKLIAYLDIWNVGLRSLLIRI